MRERRHVGQNTDMTAGITPARAGKTGGVVNPLCEAEDHPRSCGKDYSIPIGFFGRSGSPPLVRERRGRHAGPGPLSGITPARAGKTIHIKFFRANVQDHPRSCGKDKTVLAKKSFTGGSPPLVRERRFRQLIGAINRRITPARAGKT